MATNTYVELDKITVGTAVASVTFNSIPQTYTDLVIVASPVGATATTFPWMRFNGLSTSIYSDTYLNGSGASANNTGRRAAQSRGYLAEYVEQSTSVRAVTVVNIMDYTNTTLNKTYFSRNSNIGSGTYVGTELIAGLAQTTTAVTSITIGCASGGVDYNLGVGSTFALYGIKKTTTLTGTAKATGGTITYDMSGYVYHTFTASGTFTPNQSLTCDYLVIGGGGGSGNAQAGAYDGGAGGAGGLRSTLGMTGGGGALETPLSLTATGYTVTIGNGGGSATAGQNTVFGSITATGGGRGYSNTAGTTGGSGGGAGLTINNYYAGTTGQGYSGGIESGGGAGGIGGWYTGGIGAFLPEWSSPTGTGDRGYYAGGGGRAYNSWAGGLGGGGTGANGTTGGNGTANTGGGGGGSRALSGSVGGSSGGSGLVIVRYYGL